MEVKKLSDGMTTTVDLKESVYCGLGDRPKIPYELVVLKKANQPKREESSQKTRNPLARDEDEYY